MKAKYFLRYKLIIEKLQRSKYASYSEIETYLYDKFNILDYDFNYSLRTFQRDKNDIFELFGVSIMSDSFEKSYFINEDEISSPAKKLLDAFTLTNIMQLLSDASEFISFENQNIGHASLFYELSDVIKSKNRIKMYYQKYYEDTHDEYILEPLALKEFRQRWYLIARNVNEEHVRTFGLDSILSIEVQKALFENTDFNLDNLFKDFYGIINDINTKFTEVVLSFDSFQGNYIKNLPLHHSQEIIEDNENELIIKLKLHITFDFKQKLLSYGKFLRVISPESLKKEIKEDLELALNQYI